MKAASAIEASENATALRLAFEKRIAAETAEARGKIPQLEKLRTQLEDDVAGHCALLALAEAPLGFSSVSGRTSLDFEADEPVSLEVLAGRHELPPPQRHVGWAHRSGYKLLAGIGGGTVFGISLGLLAGKLELHSISDEWPWLLLWASLGSSIMALAGASLSSLGQSLGGQLYRAGIRLPWSRGLQAILTALLLAGLVTALVLIESKVEQLGLLKALVEQSSLDGFSVDVGDLGWVSLMLVVPTVASYVVLGLREGERLANLVRLQALQEDASAETRSRPEYALASGLVARVRDLAGRKAEVDSQIAAEKARIRTEFTLEENAAAGRHGDGRGSGKLRSGRLHARPLPWTADPVVATHQRRLGRLASLQAEGAACAPGCRLMARRRIPYENRGSLTLREAMEYAGVGYSKARRFVSEGGWRAYRNGREIRVIKRSLDEWMDREAADSKLD